MSEISVHKRISFIIFTELQRDTACAKDGRVKDELRMDCCRMKKRFLEQ